VAGLDGAAQGIAVRIGTEVRGRRRRRLRRLAYGRGCLLCVEAEY
jgi:hypothetical protein